MIRVRLLGVAVLLAGMACSTTSSAPEAVAPAGPDAEGQVVASVSSTPGSISPTSTEATAASSAAPEIPLAKRAAEVAERVDQIVTRSRQALGEVEASFATSRAHAGDVFARLARLRTVLQESGFTGKALTELDKLDQDAAALNQASETLQADLRGEQLSLATLSNRSQDVRKLVASEEVSSETLPPAQLSDLDAAASADQQSGRLPALTARTDKLVRGVARLVSKLDRVERDLADVLGPMGGAATDGSTLQASSPASAKTAASGTAAKSAGPLRSDEQDDTASSKGEIAEITTNKGTLLLEFFPDVAPNHVQNFKRLVRDGFYDGLTFHRVLADYIIQGGCPNGDGSGGPGWQVDNEFNRRPHRRGTLSMARFAHPDSAGSQFFICLDDRPELDGKQTVFGRVIRGEATLEAIEAAANPDESGMPIERIEIKKIILRQWQQGDNETSMIAGNPVR